MYFNLAMDLSNNMFAYHMCGVLSHLSSVDGLAPDPEAEALGYLKTFHAEALAEALEDEAVEESEDYPEDCMDSQWDDEQAFASAGFGMDESYNDGGAYREDFGYFGEMGMMED